jgi:serine/threonine-protein kinase
MMATDDPLGLMGEMIGQFRVGSAIARVGSGFLCGGRDLTRMDGTSPTPVWLQFFDWQRSAYEGLIRKATDEWRPFRHPAFSAIIGCETLPNYPALVAMEVGKGTPLTEVLAKGPMAPIEVTKLALVLCEGLNDAHQRGLLHLGISCATILVPRFDGEHPSFFGFDIPAPPATSVDGGRHLAPEQLMAAIECDQRADIYALGMVMFRCLAGEYPTEGPSRSLRDRIPSSSTAIAEIVEQCLQVDRAHRFQTSAVLAHALRYCLRPPEANAAPPRRIALPAPTSMEPKWRATADQATLPSSAAPARKPAANEDLIGQQIKECRVERLLEEGGSSRIYLATHCRLPRQWVVKVAKGPRIKDVEQWFEQEARVTSVLRQQGERVVEVADWDRLPSGRPYIVMEFIEGRSLDKVLAAHGALPIDESLEIIYRVCETLEHAHALGFLHRDIKPANILLEEKRRKRTDSVVVLDWGMARGAGKERVKITDAGTIFGTAGYRAPEVPLAVDGRADTFSVATVLYEMLAGKRAFVGNDDQNLVIAVNTAYPDSLVTIRPGISQALSDIVAVGMAKNPEKRPDMRSFRRSLYNYIDQVESKRSVTGPTAPLRRILTGAPTATVTGMKAPTRAVLNSETRDILHRLIEPEKTRPLGSPPPASRRSAPAPRSLVTVHRSTRIFGIVVIGIVAFGVGTRVAFTRLRHRVLRSTNTLSVSTPSHEQAIQTPSVPTIRRTPDPVETPKKPDSEPLPPSSTQGSRRNVRRKRIAVDVPHPQPAKATGDGAPRAHGINDLADPYEQ